MQVWQERDREGHELYKKGLVKKQEEDEWIVRGLRQGGHLAWRPSLEQGRFVNPDEQEWAKKYPLGTGGKLGGGLAG